MRSLGIAMFFCVLLSASFIHASTVGAATTGDQPKYGGTLVMSLIGDIPTLNPALTVVGPPKLVGSKIFNQLIYWNSNLEIAPDLAESWEMSRDGLTVTFHLVKNALWQDGQPFTASDVKFSIEQVLLKYHPRGKITFGALDRVETPDNYTVVLRMKLPTPAFFALLGNVAAPIVPKHLYEGTDILNNPYNLNPIGTGPFKFKEYVKGDHITLIRNEKYFKKGQPYLDKLVLRIIPDDSARLALFEKGETDYLHYQGFPFNAYQSVSKLPGVQTMLLPSPAAVISRIDMNLRKPPFNDVRVRRAIAYVIDKNEILDKAFYGAGKVAVGPIPSVFKWAYNPNVPKYDFNLTMANKLLDDAGYPRGANGKRFGVTLLVESGYSETDKTADILRIRLEDVGIDLNLQRTDVAVMNQLVGNWNYDCYLSRLSSGPDPSIGVGYYWDKNIAHTYAYNTGGYNNSRFNELYAKALVELDTAKRGQYYSEMQQIVVTDLPNLWLIETGYPVAFKTDYKGLPEDAYSFGMMDNVWWTKGADLSPEAIQAQISEAKQKIESLRAQFYDVSNALKQIDQAQKAFDAGDYVTAGQLARTAVNAANPPLFLYGAIGIVVVVMIAGIHVMRKRKHANKSAPSNR